MKLFFTLGIFFTTLAALAQPKSVFYFKYNGNKVAQVDSADYIRVVTPPDSSSTLFNVVEVYRSTGKRKLIGKSATIDPITLDGQCASFYPGGGREAVTEYSNGVVLGNSYSYYPNGKLHVILTFDTLTNKNYDANFKVLTCNDSTGKATVTDGNGHFVDYNPITHTISEEGDVKNGSPDGDWHGNYPAEKITYVDTYRNGQFVSGYCLLPNGTRYTYAHKVQGPEYKGGDAAFMAYLKKKVHYQQPKPKPGAAKTAPQKKSVLMTLLITREGKPVNVRLLGGYNPVVDKELIAAAVASSGWMPSIQNGHPVTGPYNIAITL